MPLSLTRPAVGTVGWNATMDANFTAIESAANAQIDGFRLTAQTNVPVPTADQVAAGTIYLTPFTGDVIAIFDGTTWIARQSSQISLGLSSLTSGKNYDVFATWSGAAIALALSAAWTNDTTRADALTAQDGVLVKSDALTSRYVGTIRTTGSATTEDSSAKRFVYSWSNKTVRPSRQADTSATWQIAASAGIAAWNGGDADWKHELVVGGLDDADLVQAEAKARIALVTVAAAPRVGIGLDSAAAYSASSLATQQETPPLYATSIGTSFCGLVGIGYHYLQALADERSGAGAVNFYANSAGEALLTRSVR